MTEQNVRQEPKTAILRVRAVRNLDPSTYVLRFDRNGIPFRAGQHVLLGVKGDVQAREYSIYSGEKDDFFEVLIKEVTKGMVSRQLKRLKPGEALNFENPVGYFVIREEQLYTRKFLFVASGTGIAPFHSFVKTYPGLDYLLLHGTRFAGESYERADYSPARMVRCISRDNLGDFQGRVTDYLRKHPVEDKTTLCYLCGNCEMIHEAYDILLQQGIPSENLFAEVYF